ncbi:MAG: chemoreceptor glutamine deamidase CheD [Pseudomonadota bacterium]
MSYQHRLAGTKNLLSDEFAHLRRRRLGTADRWVVRIGPGEYYATTEDDMISTVLGSCVAACVRNRVTGVGGMNHFLLPTTFDEDSPRWGETPVSAAMRFGNVAMEKLINLVLGPERRRSDLEIKVFGGARVLRARIDIGDRNVEFVRTYLAKEGLPIAAQDLGGGVPRKVVFDPSSGVVFVKNLGATTRDRIAGRELDYMEEIRHQPVTGDLELFE